MKYLTLIIILTLIGCSGPSKKFGDVRYHRAVFIPCNDKYPFGYWTPGKICWSSVESLRHEECHEQAYRDGLTLKENALLVDNRKI